MEINDSKRHINPHVMEIFQTKEKQESAFEGTVLEGKERRYTIINERDRQRFLSGYENEELDAMLSYYQGAIEQGRESLGKKPFNSYLVINIDEPYAQEVIKIMKKHGHFK